MWVRPACTNTCPEEALLLGARGEALGKGSVSEGDRRSTVRIHNGRTRATSRPPQSLCWRPGVKNFRSIWIITLSVHLKTKGQVSNAPSAQVRGTLVALQGAKQSQASDRLGSGVAWTNAFWQCEKQLLSNNLIKQPYSRPFPQHCSRQGHT